MAYVIQGRLVRVDTTSRFSPPFLMAGLNAVLACLNFTGTSTSPGTLTVTFEVSNDGTHYTSAAFVGTIAVADSTPKSADSSNGANAGFIGGVWCRLNLVLSAGSTEVILDVNTYSR